jgi:hypothetical protein
VGAVKELTGRARRTASSARAKARGGGKGGNGSAGPQGHTTSAPHEGDNGVANWQWQCCCLLYSARAGQWQWGALSRAADPRSSPPPSMPSGHASVPPLCPSPLSLPLSLPLQAAAAAADSRFSSLSGRAFHTSCWQGRHGRN